MAGVQTGAGGSGGRALRAGLAALAILAALGLAIGLVGSDRPGQPRRTAKASSALAALPPGALRVLVLGDSLAGSLAPGVADALGNRAVVYNGGSPGCSLASFKLASNFRFTVPPGRPCVEGRPAKLLQTWQAWIEGFRPNLVLYLARNDLADQQLDGRWTHVGEASFDRYYAARLDDALALFARYGLPAVLMVPNQAESGNRLNVDVPEEEPARLGALAAQMRAALARATYPHEAFGVLELARALGPRELDRRGTTQALLFCPDGAHLAADTGAIVAELEARSWVGEVRAARPDGQGLRPAGKAEGFEVPPVRPRWWLDLQCDL